ncbi:hypothetical protein TKK_0011658 [Trichogramma kaykai]
MAAEEDDRSGVTIPKASQQERSAGGRGNGPSSTRRNRARTRAYAPKRARLAQARHLSQTRFPIKPDTPRPSEPILIPKLRIQFADFPYLHYFID